jgi:hypothetical protein
MIRRGGNITPSPFWQRCTSMAIRLSDISNNINDIRRFIADGGIYDVASKVAGDNKGELLDLNRDQLLSGRNINNTLLSPTYLDDDYFNTPEAKRKGQTAKNYARAKSLLLAGHNARIKHNGLYPAKPENVPNLIVTGPFQDGMFINVTDRVYYVGSSYDDSGDIQAKYSYLVFGFAPPSVVYFYNKYIFPEVKKILKL